MDFKPNTDIYTPKGAAPPEAQAPQAPPFEPPLDGPGAPPEPPPPPPRRYFALHLKQFGMIALAVLLLALVVGNVWQGVAAAGTRKRLTAELEAAATQLERSESTAQRLKDELAAAQTQADTLREQSLQLQQDKADLEGELGDLRQQVENLQTQVAGLEKQLAAQQTTPAQTEKPEEKPEAGAGDTDTASGANAAAKDLVYVNVMELASGNFSKAQYHKFGCAKLDDKYYAAVPPSVVSLSGLKACPVCHK